MHLATVDRHNLQYCLDSLRSLILCAFALMKFQHPCCVCRICVSESRMKYFGTVACQRGFYGVVKSCIITEDLSGVVWWETFLFLFPRLFLLWINPYCSMKRRGKEWTFPSPAAAVWPPRMIWCTTTTAVIWILWYSGEIPLRYTKTTKLNKKTPTGTALTGKNINLRRKNCCDERNSIGFNLKKNSKFFFFFWSEFSGLQSEFVFFSLLSKIC